MIDFTAVTAKRVGALLGRIAKAVTFSGLGRVGALFSLLFLQPFQPHVRQVCFFYDSVYRAMHLTYSLMCLAPSYPPISSAFPTSRSPGLPFLYLLTVFIVQCA
jgi:hypothetical protein